MALARAEGGNELRVWIFHPGVVAAAVALGFVEERQLLRLEIDLPTAEIPDYPDAIQVVPFRPGKDEEAWLELNKRAFAGHPENGSWGATELAERMAQDWFSADEFADGLGSGPPGWIQLVETNRGSRGDLCDRRRSQRPGRWLGKSAVARRVGPFGRVGISSCMPICRRRQSTSVALVSRCWVLSRRR